MQNRVGLGTFPLVGVFKEIDKESAKNIVRQFINEGGYYLDTAPNYGFGYMETLLGEVLKEFPRDKYYVATKCGYIDVEDKTFQTLVKSSKYDDVIRECDRSLKRLNMDFIDLYMVHNPDKNTPFDETMRALTKLRDEGKIGKISVSNVNLDELKGYNLNGDISYVENRFNLISRSLSSEFEKYLLDHDIKLIPYHLLDIGMLTGIAFENYKLRPGDMREGLKYWSQENQDIIFAWVREKLAPISKKLGITIGQLNIAWALKQKFIDFVIVGTTNPKYLTINLNANQIDLSLETLEEMEKIYLELETDIKNKFGKSIREFRGFNEKFY
jgi:myo-inositol catabolism protein IolS